MIFGLRTSEGMLENGPMVLRVCLKVLEWERGMWKEEDYKFAF